MFVFGRGSRKEATAKLALIAGNGESCMRKCTAPHGWALTWFDRVAAFVYTGPIVGSETRHDLSMDPNTA